MRNQKDEEEMKREVWVETTDQSGRRVTFHDQHMGNISYLKRETLHESRWIPVSERMPTVAEHYLVVRLDRLDWCYCELNEEFNCKPHTAFTSKGVTHWLEAPPLPVEDEFERWWANEYPDGIVDQAKNISKNAWNAAKESKCV